jgi:hypothetical protein
VGAVEGSVCLVAGSCLLRETILTGRFRLVRAFVYLSIYPRQVDADTYLSDTC